MKMYRLETKDKQGVYVSGAFRDATGSSDISTRHPSHYDDDRLQDAINQFDQDLYHKHSHKFMFAFSSISQMKRWVYKKAWFGNLAWLGVTLNVYEVDAKWCMLGSTQCTFWKRKAKLVEKIDLNTFVRKTK